MRTADGPVEDVTPLIRKLVAGGNLSLDDTFFKYGLKDINPFANKFLIVSYEYDGKPGIGFAADKSGGAIKLTIP